MIQDREDFDAFAADSAYWSSGVHVRLETDLDLDPNLSGGVIYTRAVIAPHGGTITDRFQGTSYRGVFDGNGHTLSNMVIDTDGAGIAYVGLFGSVEGSTTNYARIENLELSGAQIIVGDSSHYVSALAGIMEYTVVYATVVDAAISTGNSAIYVGSIFGWGEDARIEYCSATGSVSGGVGVGSLGGVGGFAWDDGIALDSFSTVTVSGEADAGNLGSFFGQTIGWQAIACFATGRVSGGDDSQYLGGFAGTALYSSFRDCYARGAVTAGDTASSIGGFCGWNRLSTLRRSFSTGAVVVGADTYSVGGFCGNDWGTVDACFWDSETSGLATSNGGIAKTTAEMQTRATFETAGWDVLGEVSNGRDETWLMDGYPVLIWQNPNEVADLSVTWNEGSDGSLEDAEGSQSLVTTVPYGRPLPDVVAVAEGDFEFIGWDSELPTRATTDLNLTAEYAALLSGQGTEADPFLITSLSDFHVFSARDAYWAEGVHARLDTDLDLDPALVGRRRYSAAAIAPSIGEPFAGHIGEAYQGIFDGNDHRLSNLTIDSELAGASWLGLFGSVEGETAAIKDLSLNNINIRVGDLGESAAGLAGNCSRASIMNCHTSGLIQGGSGNRYLGGVLGRANVTMTDSSSSCLIVAGDFSATFGGLIGFASSSSIMDSSASGDVSFGGGFGSGNVGGLIGNISNSDLRRCSASGAINVGESDIVGGLLGSVGSCTVVDCFATGSVTGGTGSSDYGFGGLCGDANQSTIIAASYSTGAVSTGTSTYAVGGFAGSNSGVVVACFATGDVSGERCGGLIGSHSGEVLNSYATGNANGIRDGAGLVGYNSGGLIENCYATGSATGSNLTGGLVALQNNGTVVDSFWDSETSGLVTSEGGVGLTTAELQTEATFLGAGWDFLGSSGNGVTDVWEMDGYPALVWESSSDSVYLVVFEIGDNGVRTGGGQLTQSILQGGNATFPMIEADEGFVFVGWEPASVSGVVNDLTVVAQIIDNTDGDEDGLPDAWEITFFGDTSTTEGETDLDNDGATEIEEFLANTLPNNKDSDNDGIYDGPEIDYGLDPLFSNLTEAEFQAVLETLLKDQTQLNLGSPSIGVEDGEVVIRISIYRGEDLTNLEQYGDELEFRFPGPEEGEPVFFRFGAE